jgi:hypothetical protein
LLIGCGHSSPRPAQEQPRATCESVAEHVFEVGMRMIDAEIQKMPDGPEKDEARKQLADARASGRRELIAQFTRECKDKGYTQPCLDCVQAADDVKSVEECASICEGPR